jgi:putative DNA primase/helicase
MGIEQRPRRGRPALHKKPPKPSRTDSDPLNPAVPNLTDQGNAIRLVRRYGCTMHYVWPWEKWLVWNGQRWEEDNMGEVVRRAKATVRIMYPRERCC